MSNPRSGIWNRFRYRFTAGRETTSAVSRPPEPPLSGGGIQATGNYPGKARTIGELRADIEKAFSLIPGKHRLNLHASYLDNGGEYVERTAIEPKHFQSWIDWAKANGSAWTSTRPTSPIPKPPITSP